MIRIRKYNEAVLKRELMNQIRKDLPSFVAMRFEDRFSSGYPDIQTVGLGCGVWFEVKLADPALKSRGSQDLLMRRLHSANGGRALYIIYRQVKTERTTHIITPAAYAIEDWWNHSSWTFDSFDHELVVRQIEAIHRGGQP